MDFSLEPKHLKTLEEGRAYLDHLQADGVINLAEVSRAYGGTLGVNGPEVKKFLRQMGKDGWLGISAPKEYGGRGCSYVEQWLFNEELKSRLLPTGDLLIQAVMPTLLLFASDEMKARFVPMCLGGELTIAIGYSEPSAGTDLAALKTRATRTEGGYRVNGQKTWCSDAHHATHLWLTTRTGTPDSRHRGITLFIVPMNTPGITIRPIIDQMRHHHVNEVFFDDLFIPDEMRVGEENEGWKYIMGQLNFERVFCYREIEMFHRSTYHWWKENGPEDPAEREFERRELARVAADLEVCRLNSMRMAWMMDAGLLNAQTEASVAKIIYSQTHQNVGLEALRLMGPEGQIEMDDARAPAHGRPLRSYLGGPVFKFGGGTNELQRDLIAGFGLQMPRTR